MAMKRGASSQPRDSCTRVKDVPHPTVKTETPTRSGEVDLVCGQGTTGTGEADSDTASEVDDQYNCEKVCDTS